MPFTVQDFRDLVQLLEERPEWRAEMRRLVLSDEYLAVPEQIADLRREVAELRRDMEQRFREVDEQIADLRREVAELRRDMEQRFREVDEQIADLRREVAELRRDMEQRFREVDEQIADLRRDTERNFNRVQVQLDQLTDDVGQLKGENLERRYRERAYAYFGRLVRKAHVLTSEELSVLLDDAADRGVLSESDRTKVALADLILSGTWRADGGQVMVLAEISSVVDRSDVLRATDRAALLARLGTPVVPVVAGASVTERAAGMARSRNVWQMLDGRVLQPPADTATNRDL